MKKRFLGLFLVFCTLPFWEVKAQEFSPFMVSPYAGVTAGQINPASIAGTKYKFDVTVFGGSAGSHNDLLIFPRKTQLFNINFYSDMNSHRSDFMKGNLPQDARDDIKRYLSRTKGDWGSQDTYGGYLGVQMDIAHIMYSFSDRFSLAAGYSRKAFAKFDDIPEGIAAAGLRKHVAGAPVPTNTRSYSDAASTFVAMYDQISVTGAYTFIDNEMHKLKGGLTAKVLFNGKAAFATAENMTVDYPAGRVTAINGEAGIASKSKVGFGGDIGLEYEYQPAELKGNEIAEYRLKVGASLLDVGGFKTKDAEYRNLQPGGGVPNGFHNLMTLYGGAPKGDNNFTMSLPMMFTAQIDYNFGNGLFLNFTPYIAFNQASAHKMSKFSSYNLIPHYEMKNFGVSVPLQYDQYGKFTAGLGLRAWRYVWVGSNTIIKNLWPGDNRNFSADLHVMVKIPIMKGDNDRDGDGIPDKKDLCPDVPGLKKYQGCPDTDGDGIPDYEDKCPNEAGPASTQGCPDRDGDGIIDREDRCPDVPGPAEFQGCPDTDGDGIPDIDDACPNEPGPKCTKGCPDRDGDCVADKDDRCPDQAGSAALQGCPDRDGDGVPDIDDRCPDVPGPKENFGCPVDEAKVTIVEFHIDKYNIQTRFQPALDAVVKAMAENPNAVVNIVGHTDNTYLRSYNMNLSKKRAEAVKNYLVKKKADAKRITTQYYGPDKPIADNNTKEGRQRNRRSEITIVIK